MNLKIGIYRDLAGQLRKFSNPQPKPMPAHLLDIAREQTGVIGDITAARKVKVLDIPEDELEYYYTNKIPMPYHWSNCLYLEWHSLRNGRVVIEATEAQKLALPEWYPLPGRELGAILKATNAYIYDLRTVLDGE
ncbi:hypothetical protein SH580_11010 [Coraliomargarita algicola]|uniref:NUDIX hydrolase n=1 Tax=Coraliomargarita algicola TaxID=3092156 RepID=A0ABZ0RFI9_9BACT|nr:hypothetical protein [Coraliomargarita sp. J2-16]WPJ93966.1 hypothetical protein SH580_11010 [Coraliomargarita sp. J2-16]